LIHSALIIQDRLTPAVSRELKEEGAGRKAKLVVNGSEGGIFYLRWNGRELIEEDDDNDVRNEFTMEEQTLFDLATGELGVREAGAAMLISITGDKSIYDSEDITQLLEKLQLKVASALRGSKYMAR